MTPVSAKNEEDDTFFFFKAVHLTCCDDTIADCNDETFSAHEQKPHAHPDTISHSAFWKAKLLTPFVLFLMGLQECWWH